MHTSGTKIGLFLLVALCISQSSFASQARVPDPSMLAQSAEYYLDHRQFDRALELYRQLTQQEPSLPKYWERAATLALYVEGRTAAQDLVQKYFSSLGPTGIKRHADGLDLFLNELYGTFVTDRAQAFFLQGKVRSERGDCQGGLPFYRQALDLDRNHLMVLRHQIACEMKLENYSQAYDDLKIASSLNPVSVGLSEQLVEMHLYFGSVAEALDTLRDFHRYRALTPRLVVAQAVALARKTDREAAWQAFKKLDTANRSQELPPIVLWEKAKLLETDPKRKSALAKTQLTQWLRQFLSRTKNPSKNFDPYKTATYVDEATRWLANLDAPSVD